jgi:hypothetical protein
MDDIDYAQLTEQELLQIVSRVYLELMTRWGELRAKSLLGELIVTGEIDEFKTEGTP